MRKKRRNESQTSEAASFSFSLNCCRGLMTRDNRKWFCFVFTPISFIRKFETSLFLLCSENIKLFILLLIIKPNNNTSKNTQWQQLSVHHQQDLRRATHWDLKDMFTIFQVCRKTAIRCLYQYWFFLFVLDAKLSIFINFFPASSCQDLFHNNDLLTVDYPLTIRSEN